ncbi:MAG: hypothetical protein U0411_03775 [Thermodesulfovibrionales bacterium]
MRRMFVFAGALYLLSVAPAWSWGDPSRLELDYGTSHRLVIANQTLNPDAGKNREPVQGLPGRAAEAVLDRYGKSFEKEVKKPLYIFDIGGINK